MKVCSWQTGSQSGFLLFFFFSPLWIYYKCQHSLFVAKLNIHTDTHILEIVYQVCKSLQSPQIFAQVYTSLSIPSNLRHPAILCDSMLQFCRLQRILLILKFHIHSHQYPLLLDLNWRIIFKTTRLHLYLILHCLINNIPKSPKLLGCHSCLWIKAQLQHSWQRGGYQR